MGRLLIAPAEGLADARVHPILTPLDSLVAAFNAGWEQAVRKAKEAGGRPVPLTNISIARHLGVFAGPTTSRAQFISTGLGQLANRKNPPFRRVYRGPKALLLWAPTSVPDEDLDLSRFTTDVERLGEATRRAVRLHARPVTRKEIAVEQKRDPLLKFETKRKIPGLLGDQMKHRRATADETTGLHRIHVYSAGLVNGVRYYCAEKPEESKAHVTLLDHEYRWTALADEADPVITRRLSIPALRYIRASNLLAVARDLGDDVSRNISSGALEAALIPRALELIKKTASFIQDLSALAARCDRQGVKNPDDVATLSHDEILRLARDAFPDVNNGRTYIFLSPIQEIGRTRRKRQTPSGKYVWRAGYDRFDVVSGLAERGGGYDCSTYAAIAKSELGKIRDETLVLPSLQSSEQDEREAAIACLAFLGGDASLAALRVTAGTDPSPGLRRAAIWAYGFAGGEDAIMFARQRHEADGDEAVKAWITRSLALDNPCWWRM